MQKLDSARLGIPPTLKEVKIYFSQKGIPEIEAERFFQHYAQKQWKTRHGQLLKSWKYVARSWVMKVYEAQPWLFNKGIH